MSPAERGCIFGLLVFSVVMMTNARADEASIAAWEREHSVAAEAARVAAIEATSGSAKSPNLRLGLVDAKRIRKEYDRAMDRCAKQPLPLVPPPGGNQTVWHACFDRAQADMLAATHNALVEAKSVKVQIGSPDSDVIEAYGPPEKMNTTETSGSFRVQYVYPNGMYIYTVNGRVTAIQN
jgi:hypothetical protein